ncbi:hypothetical protein IMG5_183850 [Ichthyophthirius multifiliis]|uniref:DNA/RNA-binding protein Alba-like domain-containing protein n=1 Tax=Ichthyophthirius multifiliis TaxID=5932 RepID=G0R387_ICHMU|nr:hypothetical protein IMG5_183850 [Ichthyophthirius multifiliis]EGR28061.1 hypothetical protein IMG5_183850 [Ichthyophthirius multifiliis]|eukprot:XP_004027406.1 hypothetical protein IMG5_183850 [Ichthyophthirius multifiliis]
MADQYPKQFESSVINVSRASNTRTIQTRIKGALSNHENVTVSGIGNAMENVVSSVAELESKKLLVIKKIETTSNTQNKRLTHQMVVKITRGCEFKVQN